MNAKLRVLMLEDNARDAELILAALSGDGITCEARRLETKSDFVQALEEADFDLILSDCSLPSFDGLSALRIARDLTPEIPFIFVSGTIGEEVAIESLKNGATDYVLKHRLTRLGTAVRRAVAEREARRARIQAERDRERAESLFRALFDQMAVAVVIADLTGRVVRTNDAMHTLLGYGEAELCELAVDCLVRAEDGAALRARHAELISGRRIRHEFEASYLRRDGTAICGRTVAFLIFEAGEPTFFVHLIDDITERKEMERRFVEAQKMEVVGRMAAGIAHDFNNLITIIHGYSSVLLEKEVLKEEVSRGLQEIRNAGARATTLTQRLLSFSRQHTAERETLDLNSVISELDPMLRQLVGDRIHLLLALDPAACIIEVDRGQLEQVIMNLVINARDAMPDGGDVTIYTRNLEITGTLATSLNVSPGPYQVLAVSDTGCGMDEATKSRIFEPFFTTKDVGHGTGLGLWMVCEITRQAGGAINVDSQVGGGTTFHICLPKATERANPGFATPGTVKALQPEKAGRARVILVADDDPAIRMLVCEILGPAGYDVIEAVDGKQTMELLSAYPVDLLLTDLIMPDQDGIETIRAVTVQYPSLRVLAMSGGFGATFLQTARLLGSDDVLCKPFDAEALREAVERVLATA